VRLPPGVSQGDFDRSLRDFAAAVGGDWVFSKEDDVRLYDDSYTPFFGEPDKQYQASAAVAPITVEQVQQIVRIANRYNIPLYAISTGRNLGYGGSSPTYSGCLIVDLKRMNRVLEVNDREAYMIVEPGVSFIDLQRYFDDHNHAFLVATPDPGWGSPVGNALDHGISPVAGDNFGMVAGLEVVLPNGEVLRTGMGGVSMSHMWANYPYGFGPVLHGLFSQSNLGIVTKMVFWLVRKPEMEQGFSVTSYRSEAWQPMIDAAQQMRQSGLLYVTGIGSPIRESMSTNDGRQPYGVPAVRALHARRDGGSITEWEQLGRDNHIPVARVVGTARGPAGIVRATLEHARDVFAGIEDTELKLEKPLDYSQSNPYRPRIEFGGLGAQETSRGHFYFSPVFKPSVEDLLDINDTIRKVMLDAGDADMLANYGWSSGWSVTYPKACMILIELLIHDNVELNRKRRNLYVKLVDACGARGWAEYRAPVAFQSTVMNQYSFNNHILLRFIETIKDGIDPNGILAPGKSGIWPKRLRKV
jgi:4-cresol dehydrogenase (hydroxylating)